MLQVIDEAMLWLFFYFVFEKYTIFLTSKFLS